MSYRSMLSMSVAACLCLLSPSRSAAQAGDARFIERYSAFLDRLGRDPSAPPAYVVAVVSGDRIVMTRTRGTRNSQTQAPLTLETPVYLASITKSQIGLIAAQLDAAGVLPLETSLADAWPGLTLATGQDPSRITARSFLSHVSGVESPVIQWRYSDVGNFTVDDVPRLLPRHATRANRAFDYGNFGPVLYAAMAEARTGISWRDELQTRIVQPLGLRHTSARLEDFAPAQVAHCNTRANGGWRQVPLKPTPTMNAGGGSYSSAADGATYLQAFLTDGRSAAGRIAGPVLRRTWQPSSVQDRNVLGFQRHGYGLGWDLARYAGHEVVARSGTHVGCATILAFVPEQNLGVLVYALGDASGARFAFDLVQQAIDFWAMDEAADARAAERLRSFATSAAASLAEADRRAGPPSDRRIAGAEAFVGVYEAEGYGAITVSLHSDGLEARAGVLRLLLAPLGNDRFQAYIAGRSEDPWPVEFARPPGSAPTLNLDGVPFQRVGAR